MTGENFFTPPFPPRREFLAGDGVAQSADDLPGRLEHFLWPDIVGAEHVQDLPKREFMAGSSLASSWFGTVL